MKDINILGIKISAVDRRQTLERAKEILEGGDFRYFATVNPEFLLAAGRDREFARILNGADLGLCDGFGLKLAGLTFGARLPRVTGADLLVDLLTLCAKMGKRVLVVNWRGGLSSGEEIKNCLEVMVDRLELEVIDIDRRGKMFDPGAAAAFRPELALVALGAPWQEKFIHHRLSHIPGLRMAVGVGGAIDFATGKARRAPRIFRRLGLEWLWRLARQPRRVKRIFNAVVVFPLKFLWWRFSSFFSTKQAQ